jgi:hypothetical protein
MLLSHLVVASRKSFSTTMANILVNHRNFAPAVKFRVCDADGKRNSDRRRDKVVLGGRAAAIWPSRIPAANGLKTP